MEPLIEVKNIGKQYKITHERGRYIALRDVLTTIARRPFAFLADKAKRAAGLKKKEEFWALRDVSFSINKGDVVGIIGHNGAGKSTLLKILSQITPPTEGEIILRGRVGSLLEVGTGFHPELSGRENIFLNGAILGMTRREMATKFDQIVEFAGIEKFLDTPVKYYSSGMYVRLAFSVAAHMESDILLVDEVLAVGDADFQKKCLGKMDEITKKDGRTIIFVSHNMNAIQTLCTKTILLEQGRIAVIGKTEDVIEHYHERGAKLWATDLRKETDRGGDGKIRLVGFHIENDKNEKVPVIESGKDMSIVLSYECENIQDAKNVDVGFTLLKNSIPITILHSAYSQVLFNNLSREGTFRFRIDKIPFAEGTYDVGARVLVNGSEADNPKRIIGSFAITNPESYVHSGHKTHPSSLIILQGEWSHVPPQHHEK
jgi:lipopolysaccharide transport system ATP-binding protein